MVTIWRGCAATVASIEPGDWVATDWTYAASHADALADLTGVDHHVLSITVPDDDIEWAGDTDEWHADFGERREYFDRPKEATC